MEDEFGHHVRHYADTLCGKVPAGYHKTHLQEIVRRKMDDMVAQFEGCLENPSCLQSPGSPLNLSVPSPVVACGFDLVVKLVLEDLYDVLNKLIELILQEHMTMERDSRHRLTPLIAVKTKCSKAEPFATFVGYLRALQSMIKNDSTSFTGARVYFDRVIGLLPQMGEYLSSDAEVLLSTLEKFMNGDVISAARVASAEENVIVVENDETNDEVLSVGKKRKAEVLGGAADHDRQPPTSNSVDSKLAALSQLRADQTSQD